MRGHKQTEQPNIMLLGATFAVALATDAQVWPQRPIRKATQEENQNSRSPGPTGMAPNHFNGQPRSLAKPGPSLPPRTATQANEMPNPSRHRASVRFRPRYFMTAAY